MKYDWNAARDFYISAGWLSGVTMLDTAERFKIPYQTVRRRAAKEEWRLHREWKTQDDTCKTLEEYKYYYK